MTDVFMPYSSRFLHSSDRPDPSRPVLPIANTNLVMADSSARQGDDAPSSPVSTRSARKRAAPINTENANAFKSEDMSLSTPTIVVRTGGTPREPICLCPQTPKIPRPRNAFILYRQTHQEHAIAENPGLPNPEISKIIGEQWRNESVEVKNSWKEVAEQEKRKHQIQYPGYRYQPRRGGKGANPKHPSPVTEDGRCSKCGGYPISTPRTPSTPLPFAQGQVLPTSRPLSGSRSAEDAHGQRPGQIPGSAGIVRPPQYSLPSRVRRREIDEDDEAYEPLSPSPDRKRRRVTNPGAYQQTQHSTAQLNHAVSHRGPHPPYSAPPFTQPYGQHPLPSPWTMAPPPRPQPSSHRTPIQSPAFDDSLRLPPLQTHMTRSPPPAYTSGGYAGPTGATGNADASPQVRELDAEIMAIPYDNKIKTLCNISPPAPRPGNPKTETRGPLIAIEGPCPELLRGVAAAVEKALSNSDEVALRKWGGDDPAPLEDVDVRDMPAGRHNVEVSRRCVSYLGRMMKWYERSSEMIQHITTSPGAAPSDTIQCAQRTFSEGSVPAARLKSEAAAPAARMPVALVPNGFSLTLTDKFAGATPMADLYAPVDHWEWMARFWRGVVGPDLFIYVKLAGEEEIRRFGAVDIGPSGTMVVRVEEGREMEETVKRRLGFEVAEWVRGGTYRTGN